MMFYWAGYYKALAAKQSNTCVTAAGLSLSHAPSRFSLFLFPWHHKRDIYHHGDRHREQCSLLGSGRSSGQILCLEYVGFPPGGEMVLK